MLGKLSRHLNYNLSRVPVQFSSLLPECERATSFLVHAAWYYFFRSPKSKANLFDFRVTILKWHRPWDGSGDRRELQFLSRSSPPHIVFVPRGCCVNIAASSRETRKTSNLETKAKRASQRSVPTRHASLHS